LLDPAIRRDAAPTRSRHLKIGPCAFFLVDQSCFNAIVGRLRARGIVFRNDPENQTNMQTSDFPRGYGRVFFLYPNNHLFEVMAGGAGHAGRARETPPSVARLTARSPR
jgi:hypothetical protein